jgi:hypothetical protein
VSSKVQRSDDVRFIYMYLSGRPAGSSGVKNDVLCFEWVKTGFKSQGAWIKRVAQLFNDSVAPREGQGSKNSHRTCNIGHAFVSTCAILSTIENDPVIDDRALYFDSHIQIRYLA